MNSSTVIWGTLDESAGKGGEPRRFRLSLISEGEFQGRKLGDEDRRNPWEDRARVCVWMRAPAEPLLAFPPGQASGNSRADGVSVRTYSC